MSSFFPELYASTFVLSNPRTWELEHFSQTSNWRNDSVLEKIGAFLVSAVAFPIFAFMAAVELVKNRHSYSQSLQKQQRLIAVIESFDNLQMGAGALRGYRYERNDSYSDKMLKLRTEVTRCVDKILQDTSLEPSEKAGMLGIQDATLTTFGASIYFSQADNFGQYMQNSCGVHSDIRGLKVRWKALTKQQEELNQYPDVRHVADKLRTVASMALLKCVVKNQLRQIDKLKSLALRLLPFGKFIDHYWPVNQKATLENPKLVPEVLKDIVPDGNLIDIHNRLLRDSSAWATSHDAYDRLLAPLRLL